MRRTQVQLAYGHDRVAVEIPTANLVGVFRPKVMTGPVDENVLISRALAKPVGSPRLGELVNPGDKVSLIVSDFTRSCPSSRLLPHLLAELGAAGIPDEDIFIVLGLGNHRQMTSEEIQALLSPEITERLRVLNHDNSDVVRLGVTSSGTPVEFFRPVVEADVRICLGVLAFHYFAGYSGGAKAVFPGVASKAAITANHAMMMQPGAEMGVIEGNPVREDIEEAAGMLGVDFILNVLVDLKHRVIGAVAGDVTAAHRKGCDMVAARGKVKISQLADIVVASAGGHPKDVDLYQAQKALANASFFVRDGGVIILVAECPEGFGDQTFKRWILGATSPREIIDRLERDFVLGGHKAAAFAVVQQRATINLVSSLPLDVGLRIGMVPFDDPQRAFDIAFNELGEDSRVVVLPHATAVVPDRGTA
jgi:nickel-dependent lactate racemase